MTSPDDLPKWGAVFIAQLPATSNRLAEVLALDDARTEAGLAHLEALDWAVSVAGRGSRVWYPKGAVAASDLGRPVSVRVLAVLPGTVAEIRRSLPDVTGKQISAALNDHRRAGRAAQDGEVWQVVPTGQATPHR